MRSRSPAHAPLLPGAGEPLPIDYFCLASQTRNRAESSTLTRR